MTKETTAINSKEVINFLSNLLIRKYNSTNKIAAKNPIIKQTAYVSINPILGNILEFNLIVYCFNLFGIHFNNFSIKSDEAI